MSWTQGIQERDKLPASLVAHLDAQSEGEVQAITWEDGTMFMAHFYKDGEYLEALPFRMRNPANAADGGRSAG